MFTIKSTQPINWTWASFALVKGDNEFTSRASVPAELWKEKLPRLRALGVISYDDLAEGETDGIKLEELTERHLYVMGKDELIELAKANGVVVTPAEGLDKPSKKALIEALVPKLPKPEPPAEGVTVDPTGGGKAVVTNKGRKASSSPEGAGTPPSLPAQASDARKTHEAIASAHATRAVDVANKG